MCARCEALEEEVAFLKSELGHRNVAERFDALRRACGMRKGVAALVLRLLDASGRLVTYEQLAGAIPNVSTNPEDRCVEITKVYASAARQLLGKDAIETVWGEGYRLSKAGSARVSKMLEAA
jgi:DNA-binding response OmpR family regulator